MNKTKLSTHRKLAWLFLGVCYGWLIRDIYGDAIPSAFSLQSATPNHAGHVADEVESAAHAD